MPFFISFDSFKSTVKCALVFTEAANDTTNTSMFIILCRKPCTEIIHWYLKSFDMKQSNNVHVLFMYI